MALDKQVVHLPIVGLDQKAARLTRGAGTLDEAINVVARKAGDRVQLDKARGYQRVEPDEVVGLSAVDAVFIACGTRDRELVLVSYSHVLALGDRGAQMRGEDSLVRRGPNNRESCRAYHVGSSQLSQQFAEEDPDP